MTKRKLPPAPKTAEFDWREWSRWIQQGQNLKRKGSRSYETLPCVLGDGTSPVILATFSDQHIGAWGSDYQLFEQVTGEINSTPNLYVALLGDETECAIKLRSVLEVCNQILQPEQQEQFLEAWLEEIKHKVAFAVWSNHSVERQEKQAGVSGVKAILARRCAYFSGIAHIDVQVGKQVYKVAASHVFRGKSQLDMNAGPKRYARMEAPDRELILQGDLHVPAVSQYIEGGHKHVAITSGSLHVNSGYAKRYFSLVTHPVYPAVVLDPREHAITPFWSVKEAIKFVKGWKK